MKQITIFYVIILTLGLCGCGYKIKSDGEPVTRLDRVLAAYADEDSVRQARVLDSLKGDIHAMFTVLGVDSVTPRVLDSWSRSRVVEVFQPAVDSIYPVNSNLSNQIGHIMNSAKKESLELPPLKFAAVVWGSQRPIVRVDSVVLIALNHFLGADYPGYNGWPEYRRANKTPAQLPYALASVIVATQHPMEMGDDATLLNWMLYEGVLVEARMRLVDNAKLNEALGYTTEQLEFAQKHCYEIWQELSVRQMVYDTDPLLIDRLVAPAPSSPLIRSQAPGRIGCYIGYRIVKDYLSRFPDTSLATLLSKDFYGSQQSLIKSGFSGR